MRARSSARWTRERADATCDVLLDRLTGERVLDEMHAMSTIPPDAFVRAATPADGPLIASIVVRGWRTAYRGLMPDAVLDALSVEERTRKWTEIIATPTTRDHRTWVIARDAAVLGFASTGPSRDADAEASTAELYAIYLDPDHIGCGLGARLFAHAVEDLMRRGSRTMTLWALDGNARADRFYRRMGMVLAGTKTETVRGAPLPHVRYRRALVSG